MPTMAQASASSQAAVAANDPIHLIWEYEGRDGWTRMNEKWWPELTRMFMERSVPKEFDHYWGKGLTRKTIYTIDVDKMIQKSHDNGNERRIRALKQVAPIVQGSIPLALSQEPPAPVEAPLALSHEPPAPVEAPLALSQEPPAPVEAPQEPPAPVEAPAEQRPQDPEAKPDTVEGVEAKTEAFESLD